MTGPAPPVPTGAAPRGASLRRRAARADLEATSLAPLSAVAAPRRICRAVAGSGSSGAAAAAVTAPHRNAHAASPNCPSDARRRGPAARACCGRSVRAAAWIGFGFGSRVGGPSRCARVRPGAVGGVGRRCGCRARRDRVRCRAHRSPLRGGRACTVGARAAVLAPGLAPEHRRTRRSLHTRRTL